MNNQAKNGLMNITDDQQFYINVFKTQVLQTV